MEWNAVYLSIFRCASEEEGEKQAIEVQTMTSLDGYDNLREFLQDLIKQALSKKTSLSPSAACRAWAFCDDEEGHADKKICDQLLQAVSSHVFQSHSNILATKYIRSQKARNGMLFVLNANVTQGKNLSPALFVFKTDFISGLTGSDGGIEQHDDIFLSELKKCVVFPHFDGMNFQFSQVRIFQKSSSDYFQNLLKLSALPDSDEIADGAIREGLEERHPGEYSKYFQIPEEDRRQKREIFGEARLVQEEDLLEPDEISHLARISQQKVVDRNVKPVRLRLTIDDQLRFDGRSDLLNQNFFFAREGIEKFLIIRGARFQTKSHFQSVEFMKLESLNETLSRLKADSVSRLEEDEEES